jgi:hypothetical protein
MQKQGHMCLKSTDFAGFELGVLARPWIWWKCFVVVERVVNEIWSDEHGFDIEERIFFGRECWGMIRCIFYCLSMSRIRDSQY